MVVEGNQQSVIRLGFAGECDARCGSMEQSAAAFRGDVVSFARTLALNVRPNTSVLVNERTRSPVAPIRATTVQQKCGALIGAQTRAPGFEVERQRQSQEITAHSSVASR